MCALHMVLQYAIRMYYVYILYGSATCHPYGVSGANGVKYQAKPRFKNHIEHISVLYDSAVGD